MSEFFAYSALPPLEWLRVFDAAARLGNFSAAAEALGLTQAAVSQRIRKLEAHLGTTLFVRLPRGVELTVDGEAYAPHVHTALLALQRSTADLFSTPRRRMTIAVQQSVIDLWIMPRLKTILDVFPALEITFSTVHRLAELDGVSADLEARFGDGRWPGREGRKMFDEFLTPVCAPSLLDGKETDWRRLPQIAISGPRDGWREWAAAAGVQPPRPHTLRFDSFVHAMNAALTGAGVMLGSLALLGPQLESGALVQLGEPVTRMENGYWLTWPSSKPDSREQSLIVTALCDSTETDIRETS